MSMPATTRAFVVSLSLLAMPAVAIAQEPPPADPAPVSAPPPTPAPPPRAMMPAPSPPGVAPVIEMGGPADRGFQIQARLATQFGATAILSPGFSMGYRMNNFVIAGQLGVIAGKLEDDDTTNSFSVVQLVAMVYWDMWTSRDHKARMNLVGGLGVGKGSLKSESGGVTTESTAEFAPLLLGIGGDYYMHRNFALGVEVGLQAPILSKVEDDDMDLGIKGGTQSIHGMIRFTFVTGH